MKKFLKVATLFIAGFAMFAFTNTMGDSSFEGVITYTITSDGGDASSPTAAMMKVTGMKISIKGDNFRIEQTGSMKNTIVMGNKKDIKKIAVLVELMGNKYQVKIADSMRQKMENSKPPEIKYLSGTKTIAGYACNEAQITTTDKMTGKQITTDVYYTDQLPVDSYPDFKGLKGFPLSMTSTDAMGTKNTITAASVQKQTLDASIFTVPSGYKLMTPQEIQMDVMQKMQSGGGQ